MHQHSVIGVDINWGKFHGNRLSRSENIAKCCGKGGFLFDTRCCKVTYYAQISTSNFNKSSAVADRAA